MKPYIFGIGTGKTGSHSLRAALQSFGIKTYHCGYETYHKNTDIHKQVISNFKNKSNPMGGVSGIEAILDWPVFKMFKEIDSSVPNAKFILTYRNPEECALSWCRMVAEQHDRNKAWISKKNRSYKQYADMVRDHNDSVLEHFFGRPEKLLILDIKDSDETKWKLLEKFLDREAPVKKPYPNHFNHKDWQT
tara:strand:- start:2738 stop:3310 length:573 start_codon:yes stop_codon:yes gene_type:complete